MPLRVSDGYNNDDPCTTKPLRKMSRKGRHKIVRRPTGLEVYNDAARILEELLESRIDEDLRVPPRPRRIKTDPKSKKRIQPESNDEFVSRSKTMPSNYRESKDEESKKKDLDLLRKHSDLTLNPGDETRSVPSSDTDDGSQIMDNRRKKNIFKRAQERILQSIHRKKKSKTKDKNASIAFPASKRRDKSSGKIHGAKVPPEESGIKYYQHNDKKAGIDIDRRLSGGQAHIGSNVEKYMVMLGSKTGDRRNEIPSSSHPPQPYPPPSSSRPPQPYPPPSSSHPPQPYPPPPSFHQSPYYCIMGTDEQETSPRSQSPNPSTTGHSPPPNIPLQSLGSGAASSPSTTFPVSELSWASRGYIPGVCSSLLNSPTDYIEYIDDDTQGGEGEKSQDTYQPFPAFGTSGLKIHDSGAADHAKAIDLEMDKHTVLTKAADGRIKTTTTLTATRTVVMPDVQEGDECDCPDGAADGPPVADTEGIYGKMAQKLIEMADTYSATVSDHEGQGAMEAADETQLSELEKNIIACLRSGGDKHTKQFDETMEEVKHQTQQDLYDRFKSTIQNSMGNEVGWDYLAFLFYSTKGVVSAVGKGTEVANQAKELTMRYFSDNYAAWIMDQGGFDTMLSSGESDYGVD